MRGRAVADKYKLTRQIGRGGMGAVWAAFDQVLQRTVAVKLIEPDSLDSKSARARFHREAMALAQLRNEHIVQVYDYGIDEGAPFMVMELLEGEDLDQRLRRDARLELSVVLNLVRQAARGIMAAAVHGIVHRDLKPANLFLVASAGAEFVKILDFGVASMRKGGAELDGGKIVGTPIYMSPEQLAGEEPTLLWDLWALAVISYRALTGQLPFRADTIGDLVERICDDPFAPPSSLVPKLPPTLDEFFARALAKDPRERYPSAAEFLAGLNDAAAGATSINILCVDDEPDVEQLMLLRFRKHVRKGRYSFIFAQDGEQALAKLRRHPEIDVVLSDINMPVMDGLELLARIPEHAPHAPTVMVTAYGDMSNIRGAMNAGAFDFVVKPLDFKDLEATIEKAKRAADADRARSSTDSELRSLRKLTSAYVRRRLAAHEASVALADERVEGSVAVMRVIPSLADAEQRDPASFARCVNANYELMIAEARRRDGCVETLGRQQLVITWMGSGHLERALDACAAISDELTRLRALPGESARFGGGAVIGVSTGQLLTSCMGSRVCGRLSYLSLGPVVAEAETLAQSTQLPGILASESVRELWGNRTFRFEASRRDPPSAVTAYEMSWESQSDVYEAIASLMTEEGSDHDEGGELGQTMLSQTMAGKLLRGGPRDGA